VGLEMSLATDARPPSAGNNKVQHPPRSNSMASTRRALFDRWLSDRERILFGAVVLAYVALLWAFPYIPTQDGPTHVNNAEILRKLGDPSLSVLREFYTLNYTLAPNWLDHAALVGLLSFLPMLIAEKVFLTGYVALLPLSIRYALRWIDPQSTWLALLGFPFIYNYLFHMGFYNFSYSLPMFFFVIGYWLRQRGRFTSRDIATFALLSVFLYFCHIVSLVMAWVAIVLLSATVLLPHLWRTAGNRQSFVREAWPAVRAHALVPICAATPAAILAGIFLHQQGGIGSLVFLPHRLLLDRLLHLDALVSFDNRERWFSTSIVLLFAGLLAYFGSRRLRRRTIHRSDALVLLAAAFAAIYLLAPQAMANGGWLNDRLSLYPFFALILWFGAQPVGGRLRLALSIVALGAAGSVLALQFSNYARLNPYLAEYISAGAYVEPNTTLLPLCFSYGQAPDGGALSTKVAPFLHSAGYIAANRGVIDLNNYEATETYFPTRFRPQLDPFRYIGLGGRECTPEAKAPRVEFLTYPQRTGGHVDYVLLWAVRAEQMDDPDAQSVFRQLQQAYELIWASPDPGLAQLYRRKAGT
jgi:hypothetical protein